MRKALTISNWKRYGLICREGETYDDIYNYVMSVNNCELCNIELSNGASRYDCRCMDHNHETGYFRQVLCHNCNTKYDRKSHKLSKKTKTGHMWITPQFTKNKSGNISVSFRYSRKGFKRKTSQSLTLLICLSFINIIKKPI